MRAGRKRGSPLAVVRAHFRNDALFSGLDLGSDKRDRRIVCAYRIVGKWQQSPTTSHSNIVKRLINSDGHISNRFS